MDVVNCAMLIQVIPIPSTASNRELVQYSWQKGFPCSHTVMLELAWSDLLHVCKSQQCTHVRSSTLETLEAPFGHSCATHLQTSLRLHAMNTCTSIQLRLTPLPRVAAGPERNSSA